MEKLLERIKVFAGQSHGKQMRRYADDLYIVHPVRVMQTCSQFTGDVAILAAALLHDVLEDTRVTPGELERFLTSIFDKIMAARTLSLVEELTDVYTKKNHPRLNRRKRKALEVERLSRVSADAQTIKYADIIDNSGDVTLHEPDFAKVYLWECSQLLDVMKSGNHALRDVAIHKVNACLRMLFPGDPHGPAFNSFTVPFHQKG